MLYKLTSAKLALFLQQSTELLVNYADTMLQNNPQFTI